MRRRTFAPLIAAAVIVGAWAPAHAVGGGWWSSIQLDAPVAGLGERVKVESHLMFESIEAAERARATGGHYVYLLRDLDPAILRRAMKVGEPGDWWTPPPQRWLVGEVRFADLDANLADAVARATIPEVTPGKYSLMFCTAGCAEPVANVIPLDIRVSPDPELAARVRTLTARKWDLKHSAALSRRRLVKARREVGDLTDALEVRTRRSEKLEERVDDLSAALSSDSSDGSGPEVGAALGAGFLLGGLAGAGLRRMRRLRSAPGPSGEPAAARR